jgi:hypothetical protein
MIPLVRCARKRLDLEKTETAWRYMDRYGTDIIQREQQ